MVPLAEAKPLVLAALAEGETVTAAMARVGRLPKTYENWRRDDKEFARLVDEARRARREGRPAAETGSRDIGFAEFRRRYLFRETYPHMQMLVDVLEGRDPEVMEGCDWEPSRPGRVVVNFPPFHAKTQVLIDYVTYRICMNRNTKIIVVSKRNDQARKFLKQVRARLEGPHFAALQAAYAPEGGFRPAKGEGTWGANAMYVAGIDADQKDPTLEALGMEGQIYGSRADLILLDDVVVRRNAHEFEKQADWIESEVVSRTKGGKVVILGTRLMGMDLYRHLADGTRYPSGKSPWSFLRAPMVLRFAEDPKDWVTLWPRSTQPLEEDPDEAPEPDEDGMYPAWDGPAAAEVRESSTAATWALVYQQQQTADDSSFTPVCVNGSVNRMRKPGPLRAAAPGHPARGPEGMYTIASMDPAMSGSTFTIVGKVDPVSKQRYIENAWSRESPGAEYFREHIKQVTVEYGVDEWVIERTGFQGFLTEDPEIRRFLASRGVKMTPHYTGSNKLDPDFGVASVSGLFGTSRKRKADGSGGDVFNPGSNLIELPDPDKSFGVRSLIEQLLTWVPGVRGSKLVQDGPMALWFWELRARAVLERGSPDAPPATSVKVPFVGKRFGGAKARRPVSSLGRRVVTARG